MASHIRRTYFNTRCKGVRRGNDGRIVPFEDTLLYKVTPEQATRKLRLMYKDSSILIDTVDVYEERRIMSSEQFRHYASIES